jgi:hypothetical protein
VVERNDLRLKLRDAVGGPPDGAILRGFDFISVDVQVDGRRMYVDPRPDKEISPS